MEEKPKMPDWIKRHAIDAGKLTKDESKTLILNFVKDFVSDSLSDKHGTRETIVEQTEDGGFVIIQPAKQSHFRAAWPIEKQKFGRPDQEDLFTKLDLKTKEQVANEKIELVGINYTAGLNRVFTSIQRLLEKTNYLGTEAPIQADGRNVFKHSGIIPIMKVTLPQFYEAYGLKRYKTKRGKYEFSGRDTREALDALRDAENKKFLFWIERDVWKTTKDGKREKKRETITAVRPAFILSEHREDLTEKEKERLLKFKVNKLTGATPEDVTIDNKLIALTIEPAAPFVEGIKNKFILKSVDYLDEIRQIAPPRSKYPTLFVDWLHIQAHNIARSEEGKLKKSPDNKTIPEAWTVKRTLKYLAAELRMEPWIQSRNWKQIRKAVKRCADVAVALGYLIGPPKILKRATGEVWEFPLNPEKFTQAQDLRIKRKALERAGETAR